MTALPLYDGTFSTDAVAAAGLELLNRLHDEAMATIASLAENWDRPVDAEQPAAAREDDEPTTWSDPETWSVRDDEDDEDAGDDEDDGDAVEVRALPLSALPPLLPLRRPRRATPRVLAGRRPADAVVSADAATDEFAVPTTQGVARHPVAV